MSIVFLHFLQLLFLRKCAIMEKSRDGCMKKVVLIIVMLILVGGSFLFFFMTENSYKDVVKENKELNRNITKLKKDIDLNKENNTKHNEEINTLTEKHKEELKEQNIWKKTKENLEKAL